MIVGKTESLAIDSHISVPYHSVGMLALGHFSLYINGRIYGVRKPDASLLACSFDAVQRRVKRRGLHQPSWSERSSQEIVEAVRASLYDPDRQNDTFFGMSVPMFIDTIVETEVIWAPDGDAAFDDGSHVLQFDLGSMTRLIGFINESSLEVSLSTMTELYVNGDEFYSLLSTWSSSFLRERQVALDHPENGTANPI